MNIFDEALPTAPQPNYTVSSYLFDHWQPDQGDFDLHLPTCTKARSEVRQEITEIIKANLYMPVGMTDINTRLKDPKDFYRAMSALQKAVRRGNTELACRAAHALIMANQEQNCWRRIATIAMEDVGLANPYAVACAIALASSKILRAQLVWKKCLFWILEELCGSPKSRDLTDVVVYAMLPGALQDNFNSLRPLTPEDLSVSASNDNFPLTFGQRLTANWLLTGSKFQAWGVPMTQHPKEFGREVLETMKIPPLLRFIMVQGRRATGDALDIAVPFVWRLICGSPYVCGIEQPWEKHDETMIGQTYAASLDRYTLLGKAALRTFLKKNTAVQEALEPCKGEHFSALERAVFYTDGGLLRPMLTFEKQSQLFDDVLTAKMLDNGFPDYETGKKFYDVVSDNIVDLNGIRRWYAKKEGLI